MPGIFSRLTGGKKLTLAERHQMLVDAMEMHRIGRTPPEVEQELQRRGAPIDESRHITGEALQRVEAELVRTVPMPASAQWPVNYYFILGVTPRATNEQIHRAYRRKAKEVHPDQHNTDFTRESWSRLMALISDAQQVLSEVDTRRVYDVIWRERSRKVANENRKRGELRGDWETRYRWEVAEIAELEDSLEVLMEEIRALPPGTDAVALGSSLERALEDYESELLEIRSQTHALPEAFRQFGDQVRQEMQRKQRLVTQLRKLGQVLTSGSGLAPAAALADAERVLLEVRQAQHDFDIAAGKSLI
ncbi:MAG: J domain-containing protein [Candidatus Dormibacteraeota bacterium]|nr:J domain-containing protein [Candidatus Dormibacteraeota bacterium]